MSAPSAWQSVFLGDIAGIYSGGTPSRSVASYWGGGIPWASTAEIDASAIKSTNETISEVGLANSAAKIAPTGTLLMAMYGQGKTRGKTSILAIDSAMNQACAAIEPSALVDSQYLLAYLRHNYELIRALSNSGGQENLSLDIVKKVPVLLPALREQKRIAEASQDAAQLIQGVERLIAKKQAIKRGMMQQLLTRPDDTWPLLPVGEVATVRLGGNYKNGPQWSSRPLIKMGNIARIDIDLSKGSYIPDSEPVSEQHLLRYGDVLFNTRNTLDLVGKVSIWRDQLPVAYYNSNILRLEFRPAYCGDSQYYGYALNSQRAIEDIRTLATGTTSVAAVYTRDLLKLELPVPPLSEQLAIAGALSDIDAEIGSLRKRLEKARSIKTGMMQQLLTGRTRLPVEAAS